MYNSIGQCLCIRSSVLLSHTGGKQDKQDDNTTINQSINKNMSENDKQGEWNVFNKEDTLSSLSDTANKEDTSVESGNNNVNTSTSTPTPNMSPVDINTSPSTPVNRKSSFDTSKLTSSLLSSVRSLSRKALSASFSQQSSVLNVQQQQQHQQLSQETFSARCKYLREDNIATRKVLHDSVTKYLQDVNQKVMDLNVPLTNTLTVSQDISYNIRLMNENLIKLNNLCYDINV